MCYDDDARPPIPPDATNTAKGQDLVLTSSDGNRFAAYLATPDRPSDAQIVIYPDVRGLHQFYKELALRFAEAGVTAIAIDYFGRTAGLTTRDESFEFMPHVQQLNIDSFTLDVQAALAKLKDLSGSKPIFVVGFCMGGSFTLITGTNPSLGFAGLIPFYSGLSRNMGKGTVLELADKVRYPVLGLYGGADPGIPETDINKLDEQLDKAGVEHELVIYPGAPHSFFDRRATDFAEASSDAWRRILDFITKQKIKVSQPS